MPRDAREYCQIQAVKTERLCVRVSVCRGWVREPTGEAMFPGKPVPPQAFALGKRSLEEEEVNEQTVAFQETPWAFGHHLLGLLRR